MSKFRNKRTTVDGITFDSRKEALHWLRLKADERDGKIFNLQRQTTFKFEMNGQLICSFKPDFQYNVGAVNGPLIVEDVKSAYTAKNPVYRIKNKLMKAFYGIEVKEII